MIFLIRLWGTIEFHDTFINNTIANVESTLNIPAMQLEFSLSISRLRGDSAP